MDHSSSRLYEEWKAWDTSGSIDPVSAVTLEPFSRPSAPIRPDRQQAEAPPLPYDALMSKPFLFDTDPSRYRHWRLTIDGRVATLSLDVDESAGLFEGYALKLNSYDLGVDIELADAAQRLRFEHPEVACVVVTSAKPGVFCAGANIRMLASSTHDHKVNFCKFTNETRNGLEDSSMHSGQRWIAALNGTASGGGYELALACDRILLVDDRNAAVSLPEVALLGVLPGTGGLTRLVDKRGVRRDHADIIATTAEGIQGTRALQWRLVDAVAPRSRFDDLVVSEAIEAVSRSDRPVAEAGVALAPLVRQWERDSLSYPHVRVAIDRARRAATITILGPGAHDRGPRDGQEWWALAACREFDDAMLLLRFHETSIGSWVLRTEGDSGRVEAADDELAGDGWFARETRLYWARTLKRLECSARSLITLIQPGSCFVGLLAELVLAADRSFMLDGTFADDPSGADAPSRAELAAAAITLTAANLGRYPMGSGLTRLEARFRGEPLVHGRVTPVLGVSLDAVAAEAAGLVTSIPDDLDWDDEVRLCLEERASFSPDALTAMEANLRFGGPETAETKIFGRLSAWQNWIFQRPNAAGPDGALKRYGSGQRAVYDDRRV